MGEAAAISGKCKNQNEKSRPRNRTTRILLLLVGDLNQQIYLEQEKSILAIHTPTATTKYSFEELGIALLHLT